MVAYFNFFYDENIWYVDSGVNQYVTADIGNFYLTELYKGDDKVAVGNGNGLYIKYTGKFMLYIFNFILYMKYVFYCSQAAVNFLFINRFCIDNNCYFVFTGFYFFVKDNFTGRTLLTGRSEGGLYSI